MNLIEKTILKLNKVQLKIKTGFWIRKRDIESKVKMLRKIQSILVEKEEMDFDLLDNFAYYLFILLIS